MRDAKTEEKENDKGEKEIVEVSPAKISLRSLNVLFLLMILLHSGQRILTSVLMMITRISTEKYF